MQVDGFERRLKGDEAGFSSCSSVGDSRWFSALVRELISLESLPLPVMFVHSRWSIPLSAISILAAVGTPGTD